MGEIFPFSWSIHISVLPSDLLDLEPGPPGCSERVVRWAKYCWVISEVVDHLEEDGSPSLCELMEM